MGRLTWKLSLCPDSLLYPTPTFWLLPRVHSAQLLCISTATTSLRTLTTSWWTLQLLPFQLLSQSALSPTDLSDGTTRVIFIKHTQMEVFALA